MSKEYSEALAKHAQRMELIDKRKLTMPTFKRWVEKIWHGHRDKLVEMLKDVINDRHFLLSDKETDSRLYEDVRATRVWGKILSSPVEELPTLLGTREDLDELIGERLKNE